MGQITVDSFQHSRDSLTGGVVHPILYSIKWVPSTKWVCTPQLLVSTKWLHTPSDVLMLNLLLEWVCNPFCRKWVVMDVARDGFYKMGAGNFDDQLIPNQPQKKSSMKWHWVLRGSIYKMGSTNWGGPTPPTLKTKWISILFCARPRPSCRPNRRDAFATEVRAHRPAGLPLSMPSCWQGNGYVMSRKVASSYNLVQSRAFFQQAG